MLTISENHPAHLGVWMCICHGQMCFIRTHLCAAIHMYVFVCHTHVQYAFVYRCHPSADVWSEGDLPPGWREISDSSEIYFWHVPTGTTQYHRPVASGNQHTSPNNEPDTERDPQQEAHHSLKPPNEVRRPTDLAHVVDYIHPGSACVGVFFCLS